MLERPQPNAGRDVHMSADGYSSASVQNSPVADDRSLADADAFWFANFGAAIDHNPRTEADSGGTVSRKAKSLRGDVADKTKKEELQAVAVPAILAFDSFEPRYEKQLELPPSPSHGLSSNRRSLPGPRRAIIDVG